ncbi:hypothetical protein ABL78_6952 [Leptomonas seymouri]|uniref:Uncharacterized protein n=1 Tax=Leptomonas seymouri TaxID=5684 RepID=A0A0N1IHP8_LEPSE|nr:hypothetical protein ABL78_6952 [Leptomonas seymouri]|eukprot:KPI83995.1 hypothetical protein ABL78_6952 [Leptomonas seymouri]
MYGGFYGVGHGMRGNYGGGPMTQQAPQQPLHMQARMRGSMGNPTSAPGMISSPAAAAGGGVSGGNTGAVYQLNHNPGFMMMHNQNNFGSQRPAPRANGPQHGGGYTTAIPRFGSFSSATNIFQPNGSFSSASAGSLHRMGSGLHFDYYNNSHMSLGGPGGGDGGAGNLNSRNNSVYGSMRRGSFMDPANAQRSRQPQQLSRQNSALGSAYSYGSFRQPSFSQGSVHHGATGVGPNVSMNSIASGNSSQHGFGGGAPPSGGDNAAPLSPDALTRKDSSKSLQRSYSIAGQFYNYGNHIMNSTTPNDASPGGPIHGNPAQYQQQQGRQPVPMGMMAPMGLANGMTMTIGGIDGRINQRPAGQGAMTPQAQQMLMQQQMMMQRRLANNNGGGAEVDPNAAPPKGTSESAVVEEGQSMALGRKNSTQNLTRKASEKRVGMYFKNKDLGEVADGSVYKKEGDTGTLGKNNPRARDPSLTNTVKASIVLDTSAGSNVAVRVDGRTVRAEKPGAEEVQKYDMHDVLYANRATEAELMSDSLDEIRDNFLYGCNVGLIMADSGMPSARPTEWFTWLALKSIVKGAFGKLASTTFEFTMSACLLQDDQVMDLMADEPQRFVTLTVAESPLFGNVANGMVYVCVEDAGEFNEVLECSLHRAQQQCSETAEEHGIVLCTCVLKQVKTSLSSGKQDVIVSSIFASGVGNGVIHYNRILDKNPAEPRALFYSVLHRSVHTTALFSCAVRDSEIFNYLATLQRFSKTETRRPKVGSTRAFVSYGTSTIPRIREDMEKMKDPRHRMMMQRQLEKLQLMVADAEEMLANPADSVPKTYI